jgi:hypothetical protein
VSVERVMYSEEVSDGGRVEVKCHSATMGRQMRQPGAYCLVLAWSTRLQEREHDCGREDMTQVAQLSHTHRHR